MNDSEIQEKLREAVGDDTTPPGLAHRIRTRLDAGDVRTGPPAPRMLAAVASVLALVIVVTLVFVSQTNPNRPHAIPAASPATAPSPSPAPSPTASAFAGPCKLPVVWAGTTPPNEAAGGGFVTFPGATFAPDAEAHAAQYGEYWYTYNAARHAWLPVLQQFASPDGTKYLFFTLADGTLMRVTDATTGQTFDLENDSIDWQPVGVDNEAAYAMGEQHVGLWRLPFQVGKPVMLVGSGVWVAISGGYAWGFASASVPAGAPTVLERLNLTTGDVSSFATFAESVQLIGIDSNGLPIVWLARSRSVDVLTPSGDGTSATPTTIASNFALSTAPNFSYYPYRAVGDDNGIWIAGMDGMYLATSGSVNRVSTVQALPAGGCT